MKNLIVGLLAHVDAGKTTFSEALLYESGKLNGAGAGHYHIFQAGGIFL